MEYYKCHGSKKWVSKAPEKEFGNLMFVFLKRRSNNLNPNIRHFFIINTQNNDSECYCANVLMVPAGWVLSATPQAW